MLWKCKRIILNQLFVIIVIDMDIRVLILYKYFNCHRCNKYVSKMFASTVRFNTNNYGGTRLKGFRDDSERVRGVLVPFDESFIRIPFQNDQVKLSPKNRCWWQPNLLSPNYFINISCPGKSSRIFCGRLYHGLIKDFAVQWYLSVS